MEKYRKKKYIISVLKKDTLIQQIFIVLSVFSHMPGTLQFAEKKKQQIQLTKARGDKKHNNDFSVTNSYF